MTDIVVSGRGLVVKDDKLLLVSNDGSFWYLPGGLLEADEDLPSCVRREVYEETGFVIDPLDMLYCFEFYEKRWNAHKVECCFLTKITKEPPDMEWQDQGTDQSVTMQRFFSLSEIQGRTDVKPDFLAEGKWLEKTKRGLIYQGYDAHQKK